VKRSQKRSAFCLFEDGLRDAVNQSFRHTPCSHGMFLGVVCWLFDDSIRVGCDDKEIHSTSCT
jgi:hypothetical protein